MLIEKNEMIRNKGSETRSRKIILLAWCIYSTVPVDIINSVCQAMAYIHTCSGIQEQACMRASLQSSKNV